MRYYERLMKWFEADFRRVELLFWVNILYPMWRYNYDKGLWPW